MTQRWTGGVCLDTVFDNCHYSTSGEKENKNVIITITREKKRSGEIK